MSVHAGSEVAVGNVGGVQAVVAVVIANGYVRVDCGKAPSWLYGAVRVTILCALCGGSDATRCQKCTVS